MKLRTLKPYQQKALEYAWDRTAIALFLEMRLGKSIIAIRWLKKQKAKRTLIVSKKTALPGWKQELLLEGFKDGDINIVSGTYDERITCLKNKCAFNLINYEAIVASPEIYLDGKWDAVILDESPKIRNSQAKITKIINKQSFYPIRLRAILTGLPDPEGETDFFEQMAFLWSGRFMGFNNFWHWRHRFFMQVGYDWKMTRYGKEQLQKELKEHCFFMTRKEAGVGSEKIYEKLYVEMDNDQEKLYKQIRKEFEYEYKKERRTTKWIPVKLGWLHQVAGGFSPGGSLLFDGKACEVYHLLSTELKREKVVIWCKYTNEIEHLTKFINERSRGRIVAVPFYSKDYTGEAKFKSGKADVLVAQARAGMMGLDWSISSTMIYYSNWPDNEVRKQSEDRIIHIQKKEPVLYIDLLTRKSIDVHMLKLLNKKGVRKEKFQDELIKMELDNDYDVSD